MTEDFAFSAPYALTTQLKSWMSINPAYGCIWDCSYCIQEKDEFFNGNGRKIIQTSSVEDVVAEIMTNPLITSKTPLTFFNFSDPFLPHNTEKLREILIELDKRRFTNPVGLITRTYADSDTIDTIASMKHIRPIVLVSYAGYTDRRIETAPSSKRIQLLKDCSEAHIPTLLYLRPLVLEWMEEGQIERVAEEVKGTIDGVVMSGIRTTPEIIEKIQSRGLPIPHTKNYTNKFFPEKLQQQVLKAFANIAPVYRYTSCGVSATLAIPDYNAHLGFFRMTQGKDFSPCPLPCKEGQSALCQSAIAPSDKEIQRLLSIVSSEKIEHTMKNGAIILTKQLTKEQITFIRHATSTHVDTENAQHHIDQVAGITLRDDKK